MKRFTWLLLGVLSSSSPRTAHSEPVDTWFEVTRSPGSELCPDAMAVLASIRALFPERQIVRSSDVAHASTRTRISIRPSNAGHEATLQVVLPSVGERRISTQQADCSGLSEALAVAIVLMLEAQSAEHNSLAPTQPDASPSAAVATPPEPEQAEERPPPKTSTPPKRAATHVTTRRQPIALVDRSSRVRPPWQLQGMATGLFGMGVLSRPAAGAQIGGGLLQRSSGLGLVALGQRWWSLPAEQAGGSITVDLWAITLAPCLRALALETQLWACVTVGLGRQRAVADGYLESSEATRRWFAIGPSLRLSQRLFSYVSGVVGFTALAQPSRETFVVEEVGRVARAHAFGIAAELGLRFDSDPF